MRILLVLASISSAALAAGCTGDIEDGTITDFGDAVATTARADNGDIDSRLTTLDESTMLGHLAWRAADGTLEGHIVDQALEVKSAMDIDNLTDEDVNLLVYKLWEVERDDPDRATCVGNQAILCCRDASWSCRARL